MSETNGASPAALVLIAEDDEWAARALASILEANGFAVARSASGSAAVELAAACEPAAILIGHRLPDMAGVELCRRLSAEPRFHRWTPLLLVCLGPVERAERVAAYRAGAWDVLSRPLDGEMLQLKLHAYLGARRRGEVQRAERLLDSLSGLYSMGSLLRRVDEITLDATA